MRLGNAVGIAAIAIFGLPLVAHRSVHTCLHAQRVAAQRGGSRARRLRLLRRRIGNRSLPDRDLHLRRRRARIAHRALGRSRVERRGRRTHRQLRQEVRDPRRRVGSGALRRRVVRGCRRRCRQQRRALGRDELVTGRPRAADPRLRAGIGPLRGGPIPLRDDHRRHQRRVSLDGQHVDPDRDR